MFNRPSDLSIQIPEALYAYEPLNPSEIQTWKLVENSRSGQLKMLRCFPYILFRLIGILSISSIGFAIAYIIHTYSAEWQKRGMMNESETNMLFYFFVFIGFVIFLGLCLITLAKIRSDYEKWGRKRFEFDHGLGLLVFPENSYNKDRDACLNISDCRKIILGCTSGYNVAVFTAKFAGIGLPRGNITGGFQFYILVLTNDGEWKKYLLAIELLKSPILAAMSKISCYLDCETIFLTMSFDECRRMQRMNQ